MSAKVSITLDDEVLRFVDTRSNNRSSFINEILWREKQRILLEELEQAYIEQSADPEFQAECQVWEAVVHDGLADA
jgi:hypothetical protein